jgi:hypothetical protein
MTNRRLVGSRPLLPSETRARLTAPKWREQLEELRDDDSTTTPVGCDQAEAIPEAREPQGHNRRR